MYVVKAGSRTTDWVWFRSWNAAIGFAARYRAPRPELDLIKRY